MIDRVLMAPVFLWAYQVSVDCQWPPIPEILDVHGWDNGILLSYAADAQQAFFKAPLRHLEKNGLIGELGRNRLI